MKQIKINDCIVFLSVLFLVACSEPETISEKSKAIESVAPDNSGGLSMPPYDPAMDSWNQGGEGLKKIKDTLGIKMYEFSAKPGQSWSLHTHPDHTAYVLEGGTVELFIKEVGKMDTVTFPNGFGLINGPLSDSGRNIGKTTIRMLVADIYRPRSK